MFDIAHHEARRRVRTQAPLSFLLADVDHFKNFNDVHGHEQGDKVLVAVAAAMRRAVRGHDIVARWGGEEFLIVLPDTGLEGAVQVAERIRTEVESIHLQPEHRNVRVTLTLGASLHDQQETVSHAIARADRLLYRGKEAGRNRVMV